MAEVAAAAAGAVGCPDKVAAVACGKLGSESTPCWGPLARGAEGTVGLGAAADPAPLEADLGPDCALMEGTRLTSSARTIWCMWWASSDADCAAIAGLAVVALVPLPDALLWLVGAPADAEAAADAGAVVAAC